MEQCDHGDFTHGVGKNDLPCKRGRKVLQCQHAGKVGIPCQGEVFIRMGMTEPPRLTEPPTLCEEHYRAAVLRWQDVTGDYGTPRP